MKLLALALFALLALPTEAQQVDAAVPQSLVDALQEAGYRAMLTTDNIDDPLIESASDGITWLIYFYGCTENLACTSVQFQTGFIMDEGDVVDPALMHAWNRDYRFAKAHLDDDGDPVLKYDLVLSSPGVDRAHFLEVVEVWTDLVSSYATHVEW